MIDYKNEKWIGLIELGFIPNDDFLFMENNTGSWIEEWRSSKPQPTDAEIQAAYDAAQYKRERKAEYPSVDELIVALWEGVVEERMSAVTKLEIKRQAVKAKHPK